MVIEISVLSTGKWIIISGQIYKNTAME